MFLNLGEGVIDPSSKVPGLTVGGTQREELQGIVVPKKNTETCTVYFSKSSVPTSTFLANI
jgi:hypothetical protein